MIRVLLVDDHPQFLSIIEAELAELPQLTVVGCAQSGREALDQVQRLQPDLVLLDIALPDINGLEVARAIKAQPQPARVVLVSLNNTPAYRSAGLNIADGFVAKDTLDLHLLPTVTALFPALDDTCRSR
jgi:DNA-binding NarL/FixJ family response regulator